MMHVLYVYNSVITIGFISPDVTVSMYDTVTRERFFLNLINGE